MTLDISSPAVFSLDISKLRIYLDNIKTRLDKGEIKSISEATAEAMNAFRKFFITLGDPELRIHKINPNYPPSSYLYNEMMQDIQNSISACYNQLEALQELQTEAFNANDVKTNELINRAGEASSKVIDLNILYNLINQDLIVAGDDFDDNSKIDQNFPLQNPMCDVLKGSNMAVLKREASVNLLNQNTKIKIVPLLPTDIVNGPNKDNEKRFYEGNYYNYAGFARPEGGRWHFESIVNQSNIAGYTGDINFRLVGGDNKKNRPNTVGSLDQLQKQLDTITPIVNPEDITVIDLGASEDEKNIGRYKMVDENNASFWEAEYVLTLNEPLIDKDAILNSISGNNDDGNNNTVPTITVNTDELRQKALEQDVKDFVVEITFELESEEYINFITLNPNNFNESTWLDIIDLSTASSESDFKQIPGFTQHVYDNTITDEANKFLNDDDQSQLLSPNRFAYKGKGVWSFSPILAKIVRFRIRQKSPVPNPYHRLHVLLTRTLQKTKVSQSSDDGLF